MKNLSRIAAITIPLILLSACGDTVTEQINANVGAIATNDDLPECTEDIAGQTAFVKETHEFLGCDGKEWQSLSASTVSVGDNVCLSKSLSDDSGFEIFCNGQSIGTVKNGVAGKDGANGKDGAPGTNGKDGAKGDPGADGKDGTNGTSCRIQGTTEQSATIACGTETFTMDLTGYAEVSEVCDTSLEDDCAVPQENVDLSGVSQKGPFVSGTDVTAYELENGRSLKQTGKTFGGKIENQDGSFNIRTVKLKSSFAYLVADGFYRNEVSGRNSAATIKLRALTNVDGRSTANINLVTHLEYDRVLRLVTKENKSVIEAKRAAEKSLFAAFYIDNTGFKGFAEDLNIFKEGDGNAALLAVSAMLQGDRSEAELTALLASLSVDLGDNGVWDDSLRRAQVADWAMKADIEGRLATIRANVEGWKLSESKAPAFEGHVTNFWMNELKVPACTQSSNGRIFATKNKFSTFYAAKDSVYTAGDSSLTRLFCDASGATPAWRLATDIEKDTAAFAKNLPANTIATGKINTDFIYVKEGKWRHGTELDLAFKKACVADSLGMTDSATVKHVVTWYICDRNDDPLTSATIPTAWREAVTIEADTAGFGIPVNGDSVRFGNINKSIIYVFEDGKWRYGSQMEYALGSCDTTKLNTIKKLDGIGWFVCANDEYTLVEGVRIPATWRKANDLEMDTYGWTRDTIQGAVRLGEVNKNLTYVFEGDSWRLGTRFDYTLQIGCITAFKDSLLKKSDLEWYKCALDTADDMSVSKAWRRVADTELDLSYWNSLKNSVGTILTAPSNKKRVWDADTLREPSAAEILLDRGCVSYLHGKTDTLSNGLAYSCRAAGWSKTGTFKDSRDSKIYKGVKIGTQTWMAENLNYADSAKTPSLAGNSWCYDDDASNCTQYGRLYTWNAALNACPDGWHLPDTTEWIVLFEAVGGEQNIIGGTMWLGAGRMLKSTSGWEEIENGEVVEEGNGTDVFAFTALPAGNRITAVEQTYNFEGVNAFFWSSSNYVDPYDESENMAYNTSLDILDNNAHQENSNQSYGYSVRCLKNSQAE